ncbi:hypothetical protein Rhow_008768 [Rhodococcus wratislaviensis]|uniref:Uncharacterized protein n=1 Tax=Rhodococcus wratislaviensis TaxID=44752 RepID=A0A402CL62_RHOWR|nr:hypothetical protein Rhow_008768 [Rhodococcus wratislaviensis]
MPSHCASAKGSASGAAPPSENAGPFATPRLLDESRFGPREHPHNLLALRELRRFDIDT